MVRIYIDYNVIREDLINKGALCRALTMLNEKTNVELYVLSQNEETDEMKKAFPHELQEGSFQYLKSLQNITKDITYITNNSKELIEWSELRGKSILCFKHPMDEYDFLFNRFNPNCDSADEILKKLRMYIHI